jgi:predicted small lipoprotein YifL
MPNVECRMPNVRLKRSVFFCVLVLLPVAASGCGKKGPPLAPLRLVPDVAQNVSARRLGSTVYLQMAVPSKNANGPGPVAVDHLDI